MKTQFYNVSTSKAHTHHEYTVADAIVQELVNIGVEAAFGIVSIHNLPIYDAILRNQKIHLVTARGESGAVNMADAYARATGKMGVVITSTGTGAGNAAGSLIEAWSAGTPILHLTGEIPSPYLGVGRGFIHECKDQLSMMEASCKKAYRLRKPEQVVPVVRQAIKEAFTAPTGPITLEIPINFQSAIVPYSTFIEVSEQENSIEIPHESHVEVAEKISNSRRPVIWAGGGVIKADASQEITELAELLGAAVITSHSGKGSIPESHPLCIGHFSHYQEVKKLIREGDLLISVGTRFRGNETSNWKDIFPEDHISINSDLNAFNLNYPATYGLVGDAKNILTTLIKMLSIKNRLPDSSYQKEIAMIRDQVRATLRKTLGPYEKFLDSMQNILPKDTILVRDVTVPANTWGSRLYEIHEPRSSIHAAGGGIGQGLPMAIGAQIGVNDRVVVLMVGDGGFMVNIGEMVTAAEENLPIIIILFDDKGYGILRNIQDAAYGRRVAVDLLSPDFVNIGESMGFKSSKVTSSKEFLNELEASVARRKPSIIVVDMDAVGPMAKPFSGPPGTSVAYQPKKLN